MKMPSELHYGWGRENVSGESDGSIHVGIVGINGDNTEVSRRADNSVMSRSLFVWVDDLSTENPATVNTHATIDVPAPGPHTVNFRMQEDVLT